MARAYTQQHADPTTGDGEPTTGDGESITGDGEAPDRSTWLAAVLNTTHAFDTHMPVEARMQQTSPWKGADRAHPLGAHQTPADCHGCETPVSLHGAAASLPPQPAQRLSLAGTVVGTTPVEYQVVNVLDDVHNPGLRDAIKTYSQWPTIPQLYVSGEFVGGSDIVDEMAQKGELEKVLRQ
ncbi:MAG: hypothetical protein WDW38_000153 [Sanguina aurantia]